MSGKKRAVQKYGISRKRLMDIYERLYARFGPQDWWPGETTLEVCLGAILVQNTSWANAARAIGNLKKEDLLTEDALKKVRGDRLARLIRPARFFNMKAKRLKGFVAYLWKHHAGDVDNFLSLPTEELHEELMGLDGVGRETADSITLYAAERPAFVVDAYTKRIFSRLGHFEGSKNAGKDYLALQKSLTRICPPTSLFSTNTTPCSCAWGTPAAARSRNAANARCAQSAPIPETTRRNDGER